jgi:hypothetical protein
MKRLFLAGKLLSVFAVGSAIAQEICESKAIGKSGKPLVGAARTSFTHRCLRDTCAAKAVGSDGKNREILAL